MDDLGTVRPVGDGWELRFERRYPHAIEHVWSAITDPAETQAWWGRLEAVDLRPGGRYVLAWENEGGPTMTAEITALEPPRLLELVGDIHGRLRWELTPEGDGTLLVFTSTVTDAPDGDHLGIHYGWPEALAGWHWHLAALARALEGETVVFGMDDWQVLREEYTGAELLRSLHGRWNARDAEGFAALFAPDGVSIGFDGSTAVGAREVGAHLAVIFGDHEPARYVGRVDEACRLGHGTVLVRGVAGMVPSGTDDIEPEVNAIQTIVAVDGRVALLQNTPAAFHGRPDAVAQLTDELRRLLPLQ